jgi:hypothetical protein
VLTTSLVEDSVTLSSVLGEARMHVMDNVVPDWSAEHIWHCQTGFFFLSSLTAVK